MAMDDPFTAFETDFRAQRTPLFNNYRSSPELVRIQDVLAKALDDRSCSHNETVGVEPGLARNHTAETRLLGWADRIRTSRRRFVEQPINCRRKDRRL